MQERSPLSRQKKIYGGIAASVAVHAVIVAALLISLPVPDPVTPPEEETVSVEMVPPEEAPPETPAEEEKALDLTMPEEKPEEQKAEIPPPPEPPQQEAEEQGAPPQPPAEAEAQTAEQAELPPPPEQSEQPQPQEPPPEAEQQAEAEPPPPPPPAAEEPPPEQPQEQAEQPPQEQAPPAAEQSAETSEEQPTEGQSIPVLRPVFEFGEENAGPEVTQDGDAAEQGQEAETPADAAEADAGTEPTEQAAAEPETSTEQVTTDPDPVPSQDIAAPEIDGTSGEPLASNSEQPADGAQVAIVPEPKPEPPAPKASENGEAKPAGRPPTKAKRLFSREDTQDPVAVTAMGGVPRDMRASQLCATELREQLRHASPAYQPEFLPAYRLPEGTILDIRQAAFRANGQWFNVGFRCEIDQNATKVVSFGFDVGEAVPRSQWRTRGFPEL